MSKNLYTLELENETITDDIDLVVLFWMQKRSVGEFAIITDPDGYIVPATQIVKVIPRTLRHYC